MSLRRTFRVELVALVVLLREPWIWLLVALTLLGGAAAYRVAFPFRLDIGAGPGSRLYDTPYLRGGFNTDPEPDPSTDPPGAFRWAFDDARLVFPGLGAGNSALTLRVATAQPGSTAVSSRWWLDGTALNVVPILARTAHVPCAVAVQWSRPRTANHNADVSCAG